MVLASFDVILGRGAGRNNIRRHSIYRKLILENYQTYQTLPKNRKRQFAIDHIIKPIKENGGNFYFQAARSGEYIEAKEDEIVKTVMQALREKFIAHAHHRILANEVLTRSGTRPGTRGGTRPGTLKQQVEDLSARVERLEHLLAISLTERRTSV